MTIPINSKQYWDMRFQTDWEETHGRDQTIFFYKTILQELPRWFQNEVMQHSYQILDWGCALGDGSALIKTSFPDSTVVGLDISAEAIKNAQYTYPQCTFLTNTKEQYDVVISSNCLEHFSNYQDIFHNLLSISKKYTILLIPFEEENLIEEHVTKFTHNSFHIYEQNYVLCHFAEIDTASIPGTYWIGKQLLLIYSKQDNPILHTLPLPTLSINHPLQMKATQYEKSLDELSLQYHTLEKKLTLLETEHSQLQELKEKTEEELTLLRRKFEVIDQEMQRIKSSIGWKFLIIVWNILGILKLSLFINAIRFIQQKGIVEFYKAVKGRITAIVKQRFAFLEEKQRIKELETILKTHNKKQVVIFARLVDWNIPLFQRPQHIASQMVKHNILYFYATGNYQYDHTYGYEEITPGCYLTDQFELLVKHIPNAVIHIYSTDMVMRYEQIDSYLKKGYKILYEYVDEIHADISGFIPMHVLDKHKKILLNEKIYVVATADKLLHEVAQHRSKNYILSTNGVTPEHYDFSTIADTIPEDIRDLIESKKPIIGYFGAFASWFDYELVKHCAHAHPEWNILLLGKDYDGSIKQAHLEAYPNIRVLGPINYKDLPLYARHFTVSTIPFVLNEVTESTSPVKLFEYMSMKKPIVTTAMPECRKYASVYIGENHDDYIKKIEEAIQMVDDTAYIQLLAKEAEENSWYNKAKQIAHMIQHS